MEHIFRNSVLYLNEVPAIELMFIVKALFAIETVRFCQTCDFLPKTINNIFLKDYLDSFFLQFSMSLNMPAKTIVFTAVKKWDGDSHCYENVGVQERHMKMSRSV